MTHKTNFISVIKSILHQSQSNMIDSSVNLRNLTSMLLVINRLLLSSNEPILLILFDESSSDLATEILRLQNNSQTKIVHKIKSINLSKRIAYENSIIISAISQPSITKTGDDLIRVYSRNKLDKKSKHLCIFSYFNNKNDVPEAFLKYFIERNIHLVLLLLRQRNDSNQFEIQTFTLHYLRNSLSLTLSTSDVLQEQGEKARELIFPFQIQSIDVRFYVVYFNPPYIYRVQDFTENAKTYIGGIEIRMMDWLADRLNWTVEYVVFNFSSAYLKGGQNSVKMYERFRSRLYQTYLPTKRRHRFHFANPNSTNTLW